MNELLMRSSNYELSANHENNCNSIIQLLIKSLIQLISKILKQNKQILSDKQLY
jgi:hypothetical protein